MSVDFVLFRPNSQGFEDPSTNLCYANMFFAQFDAVYHALASLNAKELAVHITGTGWPSKGDSNEAGATPENAAEYNSKVMKLASERRGTPFRPEAEFNVYIFALFNENQKPVPTSERNFGLFKLDGSPAYPPQLSDQPGKDPWHGHKHSHAIRGRGREVNGDSKKHWSSGYPSNRYWLSFMAGEDG